MFGFGRRKGRDSVDDGRAIEDGGAGVFSKLRRGLGKTRRHLGAGLVAMVRGAGKIDDDLIEEIETR